MGREEHGEGHGGGHGQQGHGGIRKRPVDTQKRLPLIRSTKELELDETSKVDAAVVSHVPNLNPNTNFSAREPHVDYSLGLQTIRRSRGGARGSEVLASRVTRALVRPAVAPRPRQRRPSLVSADPARSGPERRAQGLQDLRCGELGAARGLCVALPPGH